MKELINKPRVFLSHAKKDINFIERLCNDLRKCQIDPWIDSNEIRHGQPWLDEIFENGIPTCDSIIVYLTDFSTESKMVKKEIDASLIQKLKDNGISFLPYVENAALRSKLRIDLQTIQIPEWNEQNYSELLPRVVSEIWRSFLERNISEAINREKVKSLELQLELQKYKNETGSIFSQSEDKDFRYIYEEFNKDYEITLEIFEKRGNDNKEKEKIYSHNYKILLLTLIIQIFGEHTFKFSNYDVNSILINYFNENNPLFTFDNNKHELFVENLPKLSDYLLTFGFLNRIHTPTAAKESRVFRILQKDFSLAYTEKVERFKYWLKFNNFYVNELLIKDQ